MMQNLETKQIDIAATLIKKASRTVVFTGAGMSTDSGIPDFRSPDSGLWEKVDPFEVASIYGFRKSPAKFYSWVKDLAVKAYAAEPHPGHHALVDLQRQGYVEAIITQNIDGLHTKAGSTNIYELHGEMRTSTCISCFKTTFNTQETVEKYIEDGEIPRCRHCNGILKPNVILFGEQLPVQVFQQAQEISRACDLMIIIGSSLEVAPASNLPLLAKRNQGKLIIINLEPTDFDSLADVVIHSRAATILPEIVSRLENN